MHFTGAISLIAFAGVVSASPLHSLPPKAQLESRQSYRIGAFVFDDAIRTCNGRHGDVIQAFRDLLLLTDAVKDISTDDPAFVDFFGRGWDIRESYKKFVPNIALNLQKAGALVRDGSGHAPIPVTCEVLPTACSQRRTGASTVDTYRTHGVPQMIVMCPFLFDPAGARLPHVVDRVRQGPTTDARQATTWEHVVLHELMHINGAGYITFDGQNKIEDVRATFATFDNTKHLLYGSGICRQYASLKTPPKVAASNADSYAWLATSKYFSDQWGTHVSREFDEDSYLDPPNNGVEIDIPDTDTCAEEHQPDRADCAAIDMPNSYDEFVDLDAGECYSNGNRNWCDIHRYGTCQITVGWDTNDGKPNVTKDELKNMVQGHLGTGTCAGYTEDLQKVCAVGADVCTQPWKFCMKRVGLDCM